MAKFKYKNENGDWIEVANKSDIPTQPSDIGAEPLRSSDDNYVTDAEKAALHSHSNKTALDNVSGVNTGDQDLTPYETIINNDAKLATKEPANANIQQHIVSTSNPHNVTKTQVGLGNVDNTSDLSKPISTATNTALDLKAMQNPGICQKCPIFPNDIVIDPVANTLTIATIKNGEAITAGNPIRFFTDGGGIITMHEKTAPVIFPNFTNTNGVWFFHFDNLGNPISTQTAWSEFNTIATVYRFYLNDQFSGAAKIKARAWECHLNDTSASDHAWKHTQGTQYVNGFDLVSNILPINASGVPTVAPNLDGRNTVIALTGGKNTDDGLEYTVVNSAVVAKFNQDLGNTSAITLNATNSGLFKIRTNDAAGRLDFLPATRFPFAWDIATNSPQYITAAGVRTLVTDNRWMVNYVYALQDDVFGEAIKVVSAEVEFTTYAAAQAHKWSALQSLYPTLRDKEIRLMYQLIHYVDKSGGGAYNAGCKFAGLVQVVDQRTLVTTSIGVAGGGIVLADNVNFTPTGNIAATNVQAAIAELDVEKLAITSKITTANVEAVVDTVFQVPQYISFVATGDGIGVLGLRFETSINHTATISGGGFFYTDSAGTLGQSQTMNVIKGANTLYLRVTTDAVVTLFNVYKISSAINSAGNFPSFNSISFSPYINYADLSNYKSDKLATVLTIPSGVTYFVLGGSNTVSGVLTLPSGMTYFQLTGSNTVSGVLTIPSGMTNFQLYGSNTVSGVLTIPSGMTNFQLYGSNTVSGILTLPSGMTIFALAGSNTVSGVLTLPSGMTTFVLSGNNSCSFNIANTVNACKYLELSSSNGVYTYNTTSGSKVWASGMRKISIRPKTATWTTAMTDALLIDLLTVGNTWITEKQVDLRGNCGARTSASDAVVATLVSYGVTVLTN